MIRQIAASFYGDGSCCRGYSRDYSRDGGYSGHGDMVEDLRELMQQAPDNETWQEFQRLIQKMEKR